MYCVAFYRVDKKPEEVYWYPAEKDAIYHASLFEDDDSGLYSHIDVADENGVVIRSIVFKEPAA